MNLPFTNTRGTCKNKTDYWTSFHMLKSKNKYWFLLSKLKLFQLNINWKSKKFWFNCSDVVSSSYVLQLTVIIRVCNSHFRQNASIRTIVSVAKWNFSLNFNPHTIARTNRIAAIHTDVAPVISPNALWMSPPSSRLSNSMAVNCCFSLLNCCNTKYELLHIINIFWHRRPSNVPLWPWCNMDNTSLRKWPLCLWRLPR